MHVYVGGACPWLDDHIKSFIRRHVPDAIFVSDLNAIPKDASAVYQFCDGWELNENFAVLNAAAKGLINAYPSSDALARKDYMARVIECWTAKRPDSILKTNSPATVRLSLDYAEYVDDALAAADDLTLLYSLEDNLNKEPSDREWWILKPALVDCGAGIRIFSTEEELASNLELAEYEDDDEDTDSVTEKSEPTSDVEDGINPKDFLPTLSTPGLNALDALVTTTSSLAIDPRPKKKQQYVFKADGRIPSAQMREFVAQRYIVSIPPLEKRKWHARAYVLSVGRLKDEDDDEDTDSVTEKSEPTSDSEDGINPKDFLPTLSTPGLNALDALVTTTSSLAIDPRPKKKQQYVFKADGRIPSAQMREFVAQRYIVSIPPLEKRKWHARAYGLSVGRLKVYVFREMLALLAGEDYAPPWLNPSLRASLTNTGLQEDEDILSKESMRNLWAAPDDLLPGDWKNELFRQVCEVSAELFRGAVHTMADKFTNMNKCFELFALDFLVDTNGTAWLLEVNETPAFYEQGVAGSMALNLMESVIGVTLEHMGMSIGEDEMSKTLKARMVQVLDETDRLAKSNITEILPE
ncbi:tubulin--tyrosine ligase C12B10.04 like protein [Verticillium longisporum]|nr:tubulin--tyrosine ligase C12B10.04 like protein [Verticillium longisporum]